MTWVTPEQPPTPDEAPGSPPAENPEPREPIPPEQVEEPILPEPEDAPDPIDLADEPPLDSTADTSPIPPQHADRVPLWRHAVGLVMLLAAAALTLAALGLVFTPAPEAPAPVAEATTAPTITPRPTQAAAAPSDMEAAPTLSPDEIEALLSTPPVDTAAALAAIPRQDSPFTIIPERPRGEVITYTVQDGDTISDIAERFGLEMDTIAWSNDRNVVFALRPGAEMNIMPVDGVYYRALVPKTIREIAEEYNVDPYDIINSEFNDLFGALPETVIESGARLVIPGGTSTANDWQYNPLVERSDSLGGGGDSGAGYISFARGEPGSCGSQPNPGGTGYFVTPMSSYSWVRGFTLYHTGVDLAASPGTAVLASSPGRVIYAGWNNWGYGYLVVLAHGPFTTLYGHLSSINVGCGQMVNAGAVIGGVGSTGNSSGPHLHFEIRYNDVAVDPTYYAAF